MGIYPPPLERLIEQFTRLPGIGQKSATRVALHILKSPRELAESLAKSLIDLKASIGLCSVCMNITDDDPCAVCRDKNRFDGTICVVEGPGNQLAIEETGVFRGKYHVLHGVLSPLDGIGPEDLKIAELLDRLQTEEVKEIILATNPTAEGEATASYLAKLLSDKDIKTTRIALGVPMGGDLAYMDSMTIRHSLKTRVPVAP